MVYTASMRVKGAGGLQMRTVVRDAPSGRVGSGSQFLDVPAVGRDRLALSSLLMQGDVGGDQPARPVTTDGAPSEPLAPLHAAPADDAPVTSTALTGVPDTLLAEPTIRIFRPGSRAIYACEIYSGLRPQHRLSMSVALLREGRIVY